MIEGLKVIVDGPELVDLCMGRSVWHLDRSRLYRQQAVAMEANRLEGMQNTSAGNPVDQLKEKARGHEADYEELQFIAKHVDLKENYLLGRDDLVKLGITKSRY